MEFVSEGDDIKYGSSREVSLEVVGTELLKTGYRVLVRQKKEGFDRGGVHGHSSAVDKLEK